MLGHDQERHRLTELPDHDIEHFLYNHGFDKFFKDLIKIPYEHPIPAKKVVNWPYRLFPTVKKTALSVSLYYCAGH